jgi:hypothetical protein
VTLAVLNGEYSTLMLEAQRTLRVLSTVFAAAIALRRWLAQWPAVFYGVLHALLAG